MSRLEVADRSKVGIVARLSLVLFPTLVVGSLLGAILLSSIATPDGPPGLNSLPPLVGGLIAGAAAGLLIRVPTAKVGLFVVMAIIDLVVMGGLWTVTLVEADHTLRIPIQWAQLPIPILVGTVVQLLVTRVIWALLGRTR